MKKRKPIYSWSADLRNLSNPIHPDGTKGKTRQNILDGKDKPLERFKTIIDNKYK